MTNSGSSFLLHIETSGKNCSVALSNGAAVIGIQSSGQVNDHSGMLAPMIRDVMENAKLPVTSLAAISVSNGPGSYTGLRVGLSTAKAMCYALKIPLICVDTLQSLAWAARAQHGSNPHNIYMPVLDARRQDAYLAVFDGEGRRLEADRFVTVDAKTPDPFLSSKGTLVICGEGMEKWEGLRGKSGILLLPMTCQAAFLAQIAWELFQIGEFADLASAVPNYLKPPNITVPA